VQRTDLLLYLGYGGVTLVLIDHVEFDEVRLAAGTVDLGDQRLPSLVVTSSNEDSRALSGEQPGRRASHASVAAGNQRDLVL